MDTSHPFIIKISKRGADLKGILSQAIRASQSFERSINHLGDPFEPDDNKKIFALLMVSLLYYSTSHNTPYEMGDTGDGRKAKEHFPDSLSSKVGGHFVVKVPDGGYFRVDVAWLKSELYYLQLTFTQEYGEMVEAYKNFANQYGWEIQIDRGPVNVFFQHQKN